MNIPDSDIDLKRIQDALDTLGEHFDSVLILATRHEEAGTINIELGTGNVFARLGQVREYLIKQKFHTKRARKKRFPNED